MEFLGRCKTAVLILLFLYDVDFADSLRGLIAGDGVVLYTRDGGNTWHEANIVEIEKETKLEQPKIFATAYPNPFSQEIEIKWSKPIRRIGIYDAKGRLVIWLKPEVTKNSFLWQGMNSRSGVVKPGIYFIILEDSAHSYKTKVLKVR